MAQYKFVIPYDQQLEEHFFHQETLQVSLPYEFDCPITIILYKGGPIIFQDNTLTMKEDSNINLVHKTMEKY